MELLLGRRNCPFPKNILHRARKFRHAGFEIPDVRECFRSIKFYDVGALVWFARIIEWEFPVFPWIAARTDYCTRNRSWSRAAVPRDGFIGFCWFAKSQPPPLPDTAGSPPGTILKYTVEIRAAL